MIDNLKVQFVTETYEIGKATTVYAANSGKRKQSVSAIATVPQCFKYWA